MRRRWTSLLMALVLVVSLTLTGAVSGIATSAAPGGTTQAVEGQGQTGGTVNAGQNGSGIGNSANDTSEQGTADQDTSDTENSDDSQGETDSDTATDGETGTDEDAEGSGTDEDAADTDSGDSEDTGSDDAESTDDEDDADDDEADDEDDENDADDEEADDEDDEETDDEDGIETLEFEEDDVEEEETDSFGDGLTGSVDGYTVTLTYDEDAQIPEDAELSVAISEEETDEDDMLIAIYGESYINEVKEAIAASQKTSGSNGSGISVSSGGRKSNFGSSAGNSGSSRPGTEADTTAAEEETGSVSLPEVTSLVRLSISIQSNGREIEPAAGSTVHVEISFADEISVGEDESLVILHITDSDEISTVGGAKLSDDRAGGSVVRFDTDSFSDYEAVLASDATAIDNEAEEAAEEEEEEEEDDHDTERDISYYRSSGIVYWDIEDKTDADGKSTEEYSLVKSVKVDNNEITFGESGSVDATTTKAGDSSTTSYAVKSTSTWNSSVRGTNLSSIFSGVSDSTLSNEVNLTITPADGYYVTSVEIVCAAFMGIESGGSGDGNGDGNTNGPGTEGGGENTGGGGDTGGRFGSYGVSAASSGVSTVSSGISTASSDYTDGNLEEVNTDYYYIWPYDCETLEDENEESDTFTIDESNEDGSLTMEITNLAFAHLSYADYDSSDTDYANTYPPVYFILIQVEKIPTPLLVEYSYGNIVKHMTAADRNADTSVFANPDKWTNASDDNQYTYDGDSTYDSGTYGIITEDVQFRYVYDSSDDDENSTNWKHYANSVTESAIAAAAAYGYVFIGWEVTYYWTCEETERDPYEIAEYEGNSGNSSSGYYKYYYYFDDVYGSGTTSVNPGDWIELTTHCRLVAQWAPVGVKLTKYVEGLPENSEVSYTLTLEKLVTTTNEDSTKTESWETVGTVTVTGTVGSDGTVTITSDVIEPIGTGTYRVTESSGSNDSDDSDGSDDSDSSDNSNNYTVENEGGSTTVYYLTITANEDGIEISQSDVTGAVDSSITYESSICSDLEISETYYGYLLSVNGLSVTNSYSTEKPSEDTVDITIKKLINGNLASSSDVFTFTFTLTATTTDSEGNTTTKYYSEDISYTMTISTGLETTGTLLAGSNKSSGSDDSESNACTYTFELSGENSIVLTLPVGYTFTVVESDTKNYTSTTVGKDDEAASNGTSCSVEINSETGEITIVFTNTNEGEVPTGITLNARWYLTLLLFAGIGAAAFGLTAVRKRRRTW